MRLRKTKAILCLIISASVAFGDAASMKVFAENVAEQETEAVVLGEEDATEVDLSESETVEEEPVLETEEEVSTEDAAEVKTEVEETEAEEEESVLEPELVTNEDELVILEASADEIMSSATDIGINTAYTDSLSTMSEVKYYKFTVTEAGYFQVAFGIDNATELDDIEDGWSVSVYTASNLSTSFCSFTTKEAYTTAKYGFEPGTYYIKVKASTASQYYAPIGCGYNLKAIFVANNYWESEGNDSNTTPDSISLNAYYKGTLYKSDDADWYKFKTTKAGYFKLVFNINEANIDDVDDGWEVSIYKAGSSKAIRTYTIKENVTEQILPYAAGTYYVSVKAASASQYYAPIDQVYSLKIAFTENANWEKEANDTSSTASAISLNTTYKGLLTTYNDIDWYSFSVSAKGEVILSFAKDKSCNIESILDGWNVYIYDKETNKLITSKEGITSTGKLSTTLAKGDYYVKVQAKTSSNYYAPMECIYSLNVAYAKTPGKPGSVKATAGTALIKTSWDKVSGATGYVIYRSTSKTGTYSKIATITDGATVSYKDKTAKSGKTYYYKVKAYNKANGVTAYSSYSSIVTAKAK